MMGQVYGYLVGDIYVVDLFKKGQLHEQKSIFSGYRLSRHRLL